MKDKIMNFPLIRWAVNLRICKWAAKNPVLSRFCNYEVISYLVCGVLTTVISYVSYFVIRMFAGVLVSQCISWVLAVAFAYVTNKIFVFLSDDWSASVLKKELISFISCRLFSFFTDTAFMEITVTLLGWNEPAMKLLSNVFVLLINYIGSKLFVFKNKNKTISYIRKDSHAMNLNLQKIAPKVAHSKRTWKDYLPYLLAFFIPVLSMIMIFIGKEIYPFGDRSFLRTDLYHQYAPFFQELKDKLSNGESLFYTWDIGLGTNFMAIFAYYLSSPLNWFLFLCPSSLVIEFITYGIVLKMALSSLTMTWYLNRHNHTNSIAAAFFGIFYGLSGYMAAYSWNIMWLDCMFLLPVIFLGLERLINEDKCYLYCISLGLAILSNYYIAIMICITLVIYFVICMILAKGKNFNYPKKILTFGLFSLLAGGLAGVVLLPEIAALSYTASGNFSFPKDWSSYFSMYDMIARHLVNVEVEIGLKHWPNIYCGVGILLFVPLYFMNTKISFKEKISYLCLIIFFYLSFSTNVLNFIWHGFHYPNSLPCRQSFIYILFLLAMGYKGFLGLKDRPKKQYLGVLLGVVAFIILAEKLEDTYTGTGDGQYYLFSSFYLSILFVMLYGILIHLFRTKGKNWRMPLAIVTLIIITVESTINMSYTSVTTVGRTTYKEYDANVRTLTAAAAADDDTVFYRTEKVNNRTKNDGAWLDYPSASIFSSTAYAHLTSFYKKIGLESSTNAYGTAGSTPASNMLLGIRYSIYTDNDAKPEDTELRSFYQSTDNVDLYKNTYALPLGFLVSDSLELDWDLNADDPGINWNNLVRALGIDEDLFVPLTVDNNGTTSVSVTTTEGGYYSFYSAKSGPSKLRINYNGTSKTFDNLSRSYFMSFDYQTDGTTFSVTNDDSSSTSIINLSAYRLNEDVLQQLYEILDESPMEVTAYTSTSVDATITASADGRVVTTIPYDTGWTVTVDGSTVDMTGFKDTFVSFEVSEGTHTIYLEYTPDGFYPGLAITLICIILLIMIAALIHLWKKNKADEAALKAQEASDTLETDTPEATALADTENGDESSAVHEDMDEAEIDETDVDEDDEIDEDAANDDDVDEITNEVDIHEDDVDENEADETSDDSDEKDDADDFFKPVGQIKKSASSRSNLDSIKLDLTRSRHNSLKENRKTKAACKKSCRKRGMIMKLWGGRFTKETNELVNRFNASLPFDCRFYAQDIRGSIAHVTMLAKSGILTNEERDQIIGGLKSILADIDNGTLTFDDGSEDIHSFVEAHLIERIGDTGKKLHTGRSRNDQVALDMKLYTRDELDETDGLLKILLEELLTVMKDNLDTFMPGFTHLQKAQPITLAHHFGAYFEMFLRDRSRLADIRRRMNTCPLGAGALAGTTYPLDREYTASLLDFDCATVNSMDSVSDRDYLIEYLDALAIIMMHLSRFCEEIITWNTNEYQFVDIDDSYSTGSSIMPQKKNPDIAELIRGKTGRVYGALTSLLTTMKGLPLAYNKDMQEDKEMAFDAFDTVKGCISLFTGMISSMTFRKDRMEASAKNGFTNATDAADYLVNHGVAFRDAHGIVGQLVLMCIDKNCSLDELSLDDYRSISPVFDEDIYEAISMKTCVEKRLTKGAPSRTSMEAQIVFCEDYLKNN